MYCAMIGDLIESRKTPPEERARQQETLKRTLERVNRDYEEYIVSPFLMTLGDEFQGLLTAAEPALSILDDIAAALAPRKARFGIGLGELTTTANPRQALGDDGPAYYRARAGVEDLKKSGLKFFPVAVRTGGTDQGLMDGLCLLLDRLVGDWSEIQEQYARATQRLGEQFLVAARYGVQGSSVSRALKRAHFDEYTAGKRALAAYLRNAYDTSGENNPAEAAYNSALIQLRHGRLEEAEETLTGLLDRGKKIKDPHVEFRALGALANCYFRRREHEKQQRALERQLELLDRKPELKNERAADVLTNLGHCYCNQANIAWEKKALLDKAEDAYARALEQIRLETYSATDIYAIRMGLADVSGMRGDPDKKIKQLKEIIQDVEKSGESAKMVLAGCYNNLAVILLKQKLWEEALAYAEKSAAQIGEGDESIQPGLGNPYFMMGECRRALGQVVEAVEPYEKALFYFQKDKEHKALAEVCKILAKIYRQMGDEPQAQKYEEAALDARRKWNRRRERSG